MKLKEVQERLRSDNKRELELENGRIDKVSLSIADHGLLSGWVFISFDGGGCGFGGYHLGRIGKLETGPSYCSAFITRTLATVGVEKWEELPDQPLRCLHEGWGRGIKAIGNFFKDDWFCPSVEWKEQP